MPKSILVLTVAALALAACATGPDASDRRSSPGQAVADPSVVAATAPVAAIIPQPLAVEPGQGQFVLNSGARIAVRPPVVRKAGTQRGTANHGLEQVAPVEEDKDGRILENRIAHHLKSSDKRMITATTTKVTVAAPRHL